MTDPRPIPDELIRIFLPTNGTANTGAFDAIADTIRALLSHPAAQRWVVEEMAGRMDARGFSRVGNKANAIALGMSLRRYDGPFNPEINLAARQYPEGAAIAALVAALLGEKEPA